MKHLTLMTLVSYLRAWLRCRAPGARFDPMPQGTCNVGSCHVEEFAAWQEPARGLRNPEDVPSFSAPVTCVFG